MAKLYIGTKNPIEVPDNILAPYQQRVKQGENVDSVLNDFKSLFSYENTQEVSEKLGFQNLNQYTQTLHAIGGGDVGAIRALLSNELQPTVYEPGSLQQGQTPKVVAGTAQPPQPTQAGQQNTATQPQQSRTITDAEYQLRPGETLEQYNARIATLRADPNIIDRGTGQATQQTTGVPTVPVSSYTGPSVVDYLNSIGQPSDPASRAILAQKQGIQNYSGTASQNTQLLNSLRSSQVPSNPALNTSSAPPVVSSAPSTLPSSQVNQQVLSQYGVSTPSPYQSPMKSFTDTYKELLQASGVSEIKSEFNKVQKEFDDLQNELNDKISEINDNPWLSEGVRVSQIRKLQEKYEGKTSILTNKLNLYNSLYEQGVDEAKFIAQQAYNQYQFDTSTQLKLYEMGQRQLESERAFTQQDFENDLALQQFALDKYRAQNSGGSAGGGLTPAQINSTVNSIAGAFDNEPIVKEFNTIQGYVQLFDALGTSASDDQARIYAFAKVMDPNSVVRESEYKTVQEYSQALLKAAGINVARVFTSTGALSPEARSAMSATLNTKLNVQRGLYNQVASEYQRQVDAAYAGQPRQITSYQAPVTNNLQNAVTTTPVEEGSGGFWSSVSSWLFGD